MDKIVVFYTDESPASARVEDGLKTRGIRYSTRLANPNDGVLPAIEIGKSRLEGIPSIVFYLFSRLDQGRTVGGIRSIQSGRNMAV